MKVIKTLTGTFASFAQRITDDHVTAFAAQSAYFILMSIIPLLMLFLAMTPYLPVSGKDLEEFIFQILPIQFHDLYVSIVAEIYNRSTSVVSVSAILAAWAASKGVLALYTGMNSIYHVRGIQNYFVARFLSMFYAVGFVLAVLLTLVLNVFGLQLQNMISVYVPFIAGVTGLFMHFRFFITLFVLMLVFTVMYVVLPKRKASFKSQLPGALLSAMAWLLFSDFYSLYFTYGKSFNKIYGSMTTIILLLLWMYFCMMILLIGAEINAFFEERFRRMSMQYHLNRKIIIDQVIANIEHPGQKKKPESLGDDLDS